MSSESLPVRRQKTHALWAAMSFAALYATALLVTESSRFPTSLKYVISGLAVAAFAALLLAEVRLVTHLDELERRIQLEALALAFPLSIGLLMLLGLVQRFVELPVEDLSYRHLWPFMILFYVLSLAVCRARYR